MKFRCAECLTVGFGTPIQPGVSRKLLFCSPECVEKKSNRDKLEQQKQALVKNMQWQKREPRKIGTHGGNILTRKIS